jgi:hypothetical protein
MPRRNRKQEKRGKRAPRKQTRQVSRPMAARASPNMKILDTYVNSLNDPFEYEGPRLGWGCLVPTTTATAYLRTTVTANADGSLGLIAMPNAKYLLQTNNAGAAVATWSGTAATDLAACTANFSFGRCISLGIKAFPSIAATVAPGASYAGNIYGQSAAAGVQSLASFTPNDLASLPQSQLGIGSNGATSTGRPVDTTSFQFRTETVDNVGYYSTPIPFALPYIGFTGLPASASVVVEVVMNFEALEANAHASAGLGNGTTVAETASSTWASLEQFYAAARPQIAQVASNTIATVANYAANSLGAFAARQLSMPMGRRLRIQN